MEDKIGYESTRSDTRNHTVVWSGGCDSTYLLYHTAKKYGRYGRSVTAMSIDHFGLGDIKREKEASRRQLLKERFSELGLSIEYTTIKIDGNVDPAPSLERNKTTLIQPYLWLTTVIPYLKIDSNVYFGYISGDSVWQWSNFFKLIDECQRLYHDIQIELPLSHLSKSEIIASLVDNDLYDYTWYCEGSYSNGGRCGRCSPCINHHLAIVKLALEGNKWAKENLSKYISSYGMDKLYLNIHQIPDGDTSNIRKDDDSLKDDDLGNSKETYESIDIKKEE